jgi:hypothetical protein
MISYEASMYVRIHVCGVNQKFFDLFESGFLNWLIN